MRVKGQARPMDGPPLVGSPPGCRARVIRTAVPDCFTGVPKGVVLCEGWGGVPRAGAGQKSPAPPPVTEHLPVNSWRLKTTPGGVGLWDGAWHQPGAKGVPKTKRGYKWGYKLHCEN